jgi:dTMP kinase
MARGKFITLEGGEGSGKSTQARLLAERLRQRGIDIVLTREPGGSPFAEQARALIMSKDTAPHGPLAEALLFYAARADHLEKTIRPALVAGQWIISDRFSDSTRVYQGAAGGLDDSTIELLERVVVAEDDVPDLTLVVDLAPDVGLSRANARGGVASDNYEARTLAFHVRLREGFLELAKRFPQRCVTIDGSRSVEDVADDVWAAVEARLLREQR